MKKFNKKTENCITLSLYKREDEEKMTRPQSFLFEFEKKGQILLTNTGQCSFYIYFFAKNSLVKKKKNVEDWDNYGTY